MRSTQLSIPKGMEANRQSARNSKRFKPLLSKTRLHIGLARVGLLPPLKKGGARGIC